jgi:hypothetical protein
MKTRATIAVVASVILVGALCIADTTNSSSGLDSSAAFRKGLEQKQAQIDQLTSRVNGLEQRVRALEQSNAELRQEVRMLQNRPPWGFPQTNGVPHLTPLQTK